jgi:hypothetical protein
MVVLTSTTNNTQSSTTTFLSTRGYNITFPKEWMWGANGPSEGEVYLQPNPNNTIDSVYFTCVPLFAPGTFRDLVELEVGGEC